MKKIGILAALLFFLVIYYLMSFRLFVNEAKEALPEAQGLSTTLFTPWPVGPKWISSVSADHPLYIESQIEENGAILLKEGFKIVVMASDGTIIVTRSSNQGE